MINKALFSIVILIILSVQTFSAPKFPFPQDQAYPFGIKPANPDHNAVQAAYDVFLSNFYEESNDVARIKWDTPALTVSEGIGYGMLIMVYMDNAKNNTQAKFDKLWNCYKKNLDPNGLMNWKINGFSGISGDGQNGATDGDIDVAMALALASYQWGGTYKADAIGLLAKIWDKEVDKSNNILFPGDAFTDPKNPSYFITAGMGLFTQNNFDSHDWASINTGCYSLIKKAQALAPSSLVADWCENDGRPNGRGLDYTFDAARIPWRVAMAYCWYGHPDAKTIAQNMTTWIKTSTGNDPSKIYAGYHLNGTVHGEKYNIPVYLGPFATAAMVDNTNQEWLNACYDRLCTFIDNDNYYNQCLKVLTLLLLTGNSIDFSTATPKTAFKITTSVSPASAGSVTIAPVKATYAAGDQITITAVPTGVNKFVKWGGDITAAVSPQTVTVASDLNITAYFNAGAADLIDDCEDGDNLNKMDGKWFSYNDSTDKGKSTVTPRTSDALLFTMTDGGANGSSKSAKITYSLDKGNNPYNPYAGMGFWLKKYSPPDTVVDISAASGLTFYFKGDSCDVRVETTNVTDFAYHKKRLPKSADWILISLKWSDLKQASWTTSSKTFDPSKATKIAWQSPDNFANGVAGTIQVDDIHLPGFVISPSTMSQEQLKSVVPKTFSATLINKSVLSLRYFVPVSGAVDISLFDLKGKLTATLFNGRKVAGLYTAYLPGFGATNGTYLVRVKTYAGTSSSKITLVK
jgi:endo-1,4-beta-D-glucanase Y